MSPRKLTEADKEELLAAYRDTSETTSTLAERYGVSSSTISRFLKSRLQGGEYEDLIQRKRLGRSNSVKKAEKSLSESVGEPLLSPAVAVPLVTEGTELVDGEMEGDVSVELAASVGRRSRSRRSRTQSQEEVLPLLQEIVTDSQGDEVTVMDGVSSEAQVEEEPEEINPDLLALAQEISLGDRQSALREFFGEDMGDEDEDDDEDDDDEDDDEEPSPTHQRAETEEVQVLPITAAHFPRTCYIVTDKMSELIARPMREFRDLGHIPDHETTQKTLPIFDNHRVAKRFTHGRSQKVIKVPDSSLFTKASNCLTSKGITRILLNGKIYNLPENS